MSKWVAATNTRSFSKPTTAPSPTSANRIQGDRVVIYLSMSVEGAVEMQTCTRIGATHSVVFGGFSSNSLNERLVDVGPIALITADEQMRGDKALPLKNIDEAIAAGACEKVNDVSVYRQALHLLAPKKIC